MAEIHCAVRCGIAEGKPVLVVVIPTIHVTVYVDKVKSYALGEGPMIYRNLYSTCPCGTPFVGTIGCP